MRYNKMSTHKETEQDENKIPYLLCTKEKKYIFSALFD